MKKYLECTVYKFDGTKFINDLKLSEAHLISQIAQENERITVKIKECTKEYYKIVFG